MQLIKLPRNPMTNAYDPPLAKVADLPTDENNSGGGSTILPPAGVKGWSWGAFLLNVVWSIGNKTWIGLLCLIPYAGFFFCVYLGVTGRELAWKNKRWDSLAHFNRVQKAWSFWAISLSFLVAVVALARPAINNLNYTLGILIQAAIFFSENSGLNCIYLFVFITSIELIFIKLITKNRHKFITVLASAFLVFAIQTLAWVAFIFALTINEDGYGLLVLGPIVFMQIIVVGVIAQPFVPQKLGRIVGEG